jgi:hypothetical protein
MPPRPLTPCRVLSLCLLLLAARPAASDDLHSMDPALDAGASTELSGASVSKPIELPSADEIEDAVPEGGSLTGREIWERYLDNKIHSAVQHQEIISTDPGGNDQSTRFWVRWKDYREVEDPASEGVLAKTLVKFVDPFDVRYTGYLMILREDRDSDQFVYRPSSRQIRRVKLRDASVMGTDYSFGDVAYQDIEDADYVRLDDEEIAGTAVYVVEATLKPFVQSQYTKTIAYLEKDHYVPLRVRYWDHADVEIKEMRADPASIREFNGVWVATNSTMHHLKQGTSSQLIIEDLDPNIEIAEQMFSVFRLGLRR